MPRFSQSLGAVVVYDPDGACVHRHDRGSRIVLAKRLAALKQFDFCGDYDASADYQAPLYFVPCEPLVGHELCRRLGIANEDDLFGGIVPHRFVGTKAVVHPLVDAAARAPDGWSADFARRVADLVLQGYTAFTIEDARRAGARLLERHGCARVKRVSCCGGRGQHVALDRAALDDILTRLDPADVAEAGVVVEENLTEVTTYSVGLVSVADLQVSYYGTQRTTPDNEGRAVYGGSDLTLIRGGFGELERQHVPDEVKRAIKSAHAFDRAAEACFAGYTASRRNYDVACGTRAGGARVCGVLEQSWRPGGASPAEIEALHVLRDAPRLDAIRAASVELYGHAQAPPADAIVYFDGVDESVGKIIKYATVETP